MGTLVTFENLPFPVPERWGLAFLIPTVSGEAEIEYDDSCGDGMCDWIAMNTPDGDRIEILRSRVITNPLEWALFKALEKSILVLHTKLVDEIVAEHEAPDCGYGHFQHERL